MSHKNDYNLDHKLMHLELYGHLLPDTHDTLTMSCFCLISAKEYPTDINLQGPQSKREWKRTRRRHSELPLFEQTSAKIGFWVAANGRENSSEVEWMLIWTRNYWTLLRSAGKEWLLYSGLLNIDLGFFFITCALPNPRSHLWVPKCFTRNEYVGYWTKWTACQKGIT